MKCKKCKKVITRALNELCVPCYIEGNLPTKVNDTSWVIAGSYERRKEARGKNSHEFDDNLASAIVKEKTAIDKEKNTISIQTENEVVLIPITTENIDGLARKSGILIGKWLIHRMESEIDSSWKVIAENTWSGKLGISAKVSTSLHKSKKYVVCVYTYDYLDLEDAKGIRAKLRTLGFDEELAINQTSIRI